MKLGNLPERVIPRCWVCTSRRQCHGRLTLPALHVTGFTGSPKQEAFPGIACLSERPRTHPVGAHCPGGRAHALHSGKSCLLLSPQGLRQCQEPHLTSIRKRFLNEPRMNEQITWSSLTSAGEPQSWARPESVMLKARL